jgi:hypothetical protein
MMIHSFYIDFNIFNSDIFNSLSDFNYILFSVLTIGTSLGIFGIILLSGRGQKIFDNLVKGATLVASGIVSINEAKKYVGESSDDNKSEDIKSTENNTKENKSSENNKSNNQSENNNK